MAHRKNALGTSYRRSTDNLTAADSSVSPTCKSSQTSLGACLHINVLFFFSFSVCAFCVPNATATWEKHYNVRKGSTSATLIFTSDDLTQKESLTAEVDADHQPKSFISEVTFQTSAVNPAETTENGAVSSLCRSPVPVPLPAEASPKHSYRSLMPTNSERFAYLRRISEGNWSAPSPAPSLYSGISGSTSSIKSSPYKLSDPGPKSLVEFNTSGPNHQRSHSDGENYPGGPCQVPAPVIKEKEAGSRGNLLSIPPASAAVSAAVKNELSVQVKPAENKTSAAGVATKVATLPRPKRPEEVECDQLSKDLINHLPPSDKLHALFSGEFAGSSFFFPKFLLPC